MEERGDCECERGHGWGLALLCVVESVKMGTELIKTTYNYQKRKNDSIGKVDPSLYMSPG